MNSQAADVTDDVVASARSQAAALEQEGRLVDAIAVLSDANRRQRDGVVEEELLRLRHAAFDTLDREPGRPSWPPPVDDAFPEVVGRPPEVPSAELTAETLGGGIVHHGCLLVRGLLPEHRVDQMVADIDQAFAACEAKQAGAARSETAPWYAPFGPSERYPITVGERWWVNNGGGVWTVDSPRTFFDLLEAFEEAGVGDAITGYMGERPAISVKKSTLRRVPVETGTDWHQDGAFLGDGIRTVNVWVSLSHCGIDAPGLDIVPRRLGLAETGTHGAQFDWSVGPGMVEIVAGDVTVVRPVFEPGDALLFDDQFLHRTGVSPGMTKSRYAIESWFFAPSTYPDAQIPVVF